MATAGSVDDGKSTLIGRLLYDTKSILADQLEQVQEASERRGGVGALDLSLLTDGLRAEREQGITIDVAYRYFKTPARTFILADTPGHVQYTRNMVTGASTADLAVVLVDARHGVVEQTRRHAFIARMLGIPHLVVAVNKMDLVDFAEDAFDAVVRDFSALGAALGGHEVTYIPLSALLGDNVVERSGQMPWYAGPALLEHLETVAVAEDANLTDLRLPVQWVIRPGADLDPDYRGYAGQVASGVVAPGDRIVVLPSGVETTIASVETADGPLAEAFAGMSVTVRLTDAVDVSRGDVLVHVVQRPEPVRELEADVSWFAERPLLPRGRYLVKHLTQTVPALVDALIDRVDMTTFAREPAPAELALNDIGRVRLRLRTPVVADRYDDNRATGAFILIDEATNDTVGAGMVR
jgi:bifunctional enzyme CysN/CysC